MENENQAEQPVEAKTISVKLQVGALTNVVIKEANLLIVALPLGTPRFTALGFLWSVVNEMTTFYDNIAYQAEAVRQRKSGGIVRAGISDIAALGSKLLKQ